MVKVLIAEQSPIIGLGFYHLLNNFQDVESVRMVSLDEDCCKVMEQQEPELILVNTNFLRPEQMQALMNIKKTDAILLHIFNTSLPLDAPLNQLSIWEDRASLQNKLEAAIEKVKSVTDDSETEELSPREKAILKEVALGLTNKEIAEKTYISTHTVISHRKNITRKLGIKTVSGLTVYAILNNIIQMDDIS